MSYINPNKARMRQQVQDNHFRFAGQTATLRQWVSAVSGSAQAAGFGVQNYYREFMITALFSTVPVQANLQQQQPGGFIEAGTIQMISKQCVGSADEVVWNSIRYRVDTVGQPSIIDNHYVSILKRGDK